MTHALDLAALPTSTLQALWQSRADPDLAARAREEIRRRVEATAPSCASPAELARALGTSRGSVLRWTGTVWPDLPVGWPRGRGLAGLALANRRRAEGVPRKPRSRKKTLENA